MSDQLVVEDLESTNGTLVNGKRISRAVLREGDVLTIGRIDFKVER
jgi:pSer/pThr/pTyr-binding forkhead associated (FHA) protein